MDINGYITNEEKYFSLIDEDYIEELNLATNCSKLRTDFKVAYLVLHFQLSKKDNFEKNILLGDLFISILTRRLARRDPSLLIKIMDTISACHCESILWKIKCYKRGLLKVAREVSYDNPAV